MHTETIDIIGIEGPLEVTAIRACLEYWGVKVNTYWIGQPGHITELLNGEQLRSKHLLITGHGNEAGFSLVELGPEVAKQQPFVNTMRPEDVRNYIQLNKSVVVSTACRTGSEAMRTAFLDKGAAYYIAPTDYPDGNSALYYVISFYYHLFCGGLSVTESHEYARATDDETSMFALFAAP